MWETLNENATIVARRHELVPPDGHFSLTDDQTRAIAKISAALDEGIFEHLLKAPTGSGKTEVLMRVALDQVLRHGGYATILAPTRDLVRQHVTYLTERLEGTGLAVAEVHGGVSPAERKAGLAAIADGTAAFVVGSAMMLADNRLWDVIDRGALVVIDDVNAFDEREHLRLLEGLDCPMIFATATPDELRPFLMRVGAFDHVVTMRGMPFNVIPTKVHKIEGVWGEPPTEQLTRADELIRDHLDRGSRIFVIGRTRGDVPRLAQRLEETYGITVQQLRGDMADTSEQRKRYARKGVRVQGGATRIEMMRDFIAQSPSLLAATNLIGSGLDIPAADLIVITDADAFGEGEIEQLIGRVGRRERPSDAILVTGTTFEKNPSKGSAGPKRSFMPPGMRRNQLRFYR